MICRTSKMKAEDARKIADKNHERLCKREYRKLMESIKRVAKQGHCQIVCNFEFAENKEKLKLLGYEMTPLKNYHSIYTYRVSW